MTLRYEQYFKTNQCASEHDAEPFNPTSSPQKQNLFKLTPGEFSKLEAVKIKKDKGQIEQKRQVFWYFDRSPPPLKNVFFALKGHFSVYLWNNYVVQLSFKERD